MLQDILWYLSWGGVAFAAFIEQAVPGKRVPYTCEVFSALAGAAAMFQLPVPWAAVVALLVYAVLRGRLGVQLAFLANPIPTLAVALFVLSTVRLVSLPLTSELPVFLGAIVMIGTAPSGLPLTLCQAWLPVALALALVPHSRMFWALSMVLASLLLYGIVGSRIPRKHALIVASVKLCVFAVVVGVFRPYLAEPASSGTPGGSGLPPCTVKLGDVVATDLDNTPCVVNGNPCPLNFNGTAELVCGGARRGQCIPLDDAQNVCHCFPGHCGTAAEVRFVPRRNRYFAFGCTDTAVPCVNGSAPLDEPQDSDALRWMHPANRCQCICNSDDIVGPACNQTCPTTPDGVVCNGFPCISNGSAAQCVCDGSTSGSMCQNYNCNGHGQLIGGVCSCDAGHYPPGANGSAFVCNSTCSDAPCHGHGQCISDTACVCDQGWLAPSNCSACEPGLTTACGPIGRCNGTACVCPPKSNLDPNTLCETCLDVTRDPAKNCTLCLRGYFKDPQSNECRPCPAECAFVGCSSSTQCLCPTGFVGPTCACDESACNNTGGECDQDTCNCKDRCLRDDNVCGEPCAEGAPSCEASTSAACCEPLSGRCVCPAAAASIDKGCTSSIQLKFGH
jgi:hypothetical protein